MFDFACGNAAVPGCATTVARLLRSHGVTARPPVFQPIHRTLGLASFPGAEEAFYKYGSDEQIEFISPHRKLVSETFDASLRVWSDENTRSLSGVDPKQIARYRMAWAQIFDGVMKRSADFTVCRRR